MDFAQDIFSSGVTAHAHHRKPAPSHPMWDCARPRSGKPTPPCPRPCRKAQGPGRPPPQGRPGGPGSGHEEFRTRFEEAFTQPSQPHGPSKLCFGTHSEAGSRFVERMMTTVCTEKQQGRNVRDYVTSSVEAHMRGDRAPSLLPISYDRLVGYPVNGYKSLTESRNPTTVIVILYRCSRRSSCRSWSRPGGGRPAQKCKQGAVRSRMHHARAGPGLLQSLL